MPLVRGIIDTAPGPLLVDLAVSYVAPYALTNPYSGAGSLNAFGLGVVPYGLIWTVYTAPANAGGAQRAIQIYELPFLSLCPSYELADSTQWFTDHLITHDSAGVLWFERGQPHIIEYSILDGWHVNFQWVVAP